MSENIYQNAVEPIEDTAGKSKSAFRVFLYSLIGLVSFFVALIVVILKTQEFGWVVALFFIPAVAPIVGAGFHVKRYKSERMSPWYFYDFSMKVSCLSTVVLGLLWVLFSCKWATSVGDWFSYAALVVVAIFLALIGVLMCAFLHELDGGKWQRLVALRTGASREPVWALSFLFFVVFLNVAFLFGFALAFHDQSCLANQKLPALHMLNLKSPDDRDEKSAEDKKPANDATTTGTQDTNYHFYFESGQARLRKIPVDANKCDVGTEKDARTDPPQRLEWMLSDDPAAYNYCSLIRIKNLIAAKSLNGQHTRITLVGRSDNDPIKERENPRLQDLVHYTSNYELSDARVQNIRYEIVEALRDHKDQPTWQNLEWLSLPSSDETPIESDAVLQQILQRQTGLSKAQRESFIDQNKRVVTASVITIPGEISSLQIDQMNRSMFRTMRLIDYMYFSIYTITTTGYGDIVPTTSYSKFVVSLSNICEVLFLVVFFNALISIRSTSEKKDFEAVVAYVKTQMEEDEIAAGEHRNNEAW